MVNQGTNDRDFTVGISSNSSLVNENAMNVKTLERCFNESIDREMSNIVDTVEDRIQNTILTAIDNIVAPKIELAIRSINASSGRDATSVSANSERKGHVGIITSFENASGNNNTLGVSIANEETRHNISDEVGELSVPDTHFDRQTHTHHMVTSHNKLSHHYQLLAASSCLYIERTFAERLSFLFNNGLCFFLMPMVWGIRLEFHQRFAGSRASCYG